MTIEALKQRKVEAIDWQKPLSCLWLSRSSVELQWWVPRFCSSCYCCLELYTYPVGNPKCLMMMVKFTKKIFDSFDFSTQFIFPQFPTYSYSLFPCVQLRRWNVLWMHYHLRSKLLDSSEGRRIFSTLWPLGIWETNPKLPPVIWVFPIIGVHTPQNGWFISWKTLLKMDDLGGFPPVFGNTHLLSFWWLLKHLFVV